MWVSNLEDFDFLLPYFCGPKLLKSLWSPLELEPKETDSLYGKKIPILLNQESICDCKNFPPENSSRLSATPMFANGKKPNTDSQLLIIKSFSGLREGSPAI